MNGNPIIVNDLMLAGRVVGIGPLWEDGVGVQHMRFRLAYHQRQPAEAPEREIDVESAGGVARHCQYVVSMGAEVLVDGEIAELPGEDLVEKLVVRAWKVHVLGRPEVGIEKGKENGK